MNDDGIHVSKRGEVQQYQETPDDLDARPLVVGPGVPRLGRGVWTDEALVEQHRWWRPTWEV